MATILILEKSPSDMRMVWAVIGVLYDMVQPLPFAPRLEKPFDRRILDAYVLSDSHLEKARELKVGYDQQIRRVMVQHSIKTEFEVWTAFVMEHNREQHWYSLAEDLGNLMSSIKTDFQAQVREYLGLADSGYMISEKAFDILAPFVAAMYTVTEQEVTQWKENRLVSFDADDMNTPLITYPWLFSRELGKIAIRQSGPSALRTASAANGDVRRRAPVVKSNYKTELHSIKLEPLPEWKPEHPVGDHVGKTAFDVAAVERLEEKLEVTGGDEEAVEEVGEDTAAEIPKGDAVDGAEEIKGTDMDEASQELGLEEQSSEEWISEEERSEEKGSEKKGAVEREEEEEMRASEEESEQAGPEDEEPSGESAMDEPEHQEGEEEGAKELAEESENAYDRLMAMMSM